jgi:hypothetical protein
MQVYGFGFWWGCLWSFGCSLIDGGHMENGWSRAMGFCWRKHTLLIGEMLGKLLGFWAGLAEGWNGMFEPHQGVGWRAGWWGE